jgi:hypothetical protein
VLAIDLSFLGMHAQPMKICVLGIGYWSLLAFGVTAHCTMLIIL